MCVCACVRACVFVCVSFADCVCVQAKVAERAGDAATAGELYDGILRKQPENGKVRVPKRDAKTLVGVVSMLGI